MKYAIATTWNGCGYSYQNKCYLKEFNSDEDAQKYILEQFHENERVELYDVTTEKGAILFDGGLDQGSYQWIRINDDIYGAVILCNINDVCLVNKNEYQDMLKDALEQADSDDEIDEENPFIGAYGGEYDYQFIKF